MHVYVRAGKNGETGEHLPRLAAAAGGARGRHDLWGGDLGRSLECVCVLLKTVAEIAGPLSFEKRPTETAMHAG